MNNNKGIYIKTGASSGYIPIDFLSDEEYEYIVIPNDQSGESSGEVRKLPAAKRLFGRKRPTNNGQ